MLRSLLPLTVAALLTAAAPASAGGWSAPRTQTHAGTAADVHAAGGPGDRIALGWRRRLGGEDRAELRLGRARSGLSGAPLGLDHAAPPVASPLPQYVRGGAFAAAWLRTSGGQQHLRLRTADRNGGLTGTVQLTGPSQPASLPTWVAGPVPALLWSRETRADAVELAVTGPRGVTLPATPGSEPAGASRSTGLAAVSWVNDQRVLVADRTASGFTAPITVATGAVSETQVVRARGGATLVLWRQDGDLMVSARPAGGAFGPPRVVMPGTVDAPTAVVTRTGEVLVTDLVGDSSRTGQVQLARLGADGGALGPVRTLGRGRTVRLAADGTGSAFVAWMSEDSSRAISVRRVATGGILGITRLLTPRSDPTSRPTLAATTEGGAVVAWVRGGDVQASLYRQ